MGTRPSSSPTRATAGHSRPLARWKVESSTASASGSAPDAGRRRRRWRPARPGSPRRWRRDPRRRVRRPTGPALAGCPAPAAGVSPRPRRPGRLGEGEVGQGAAQRSLPGARPAAGRSRPDLGRRLPERARPGRGCRPLEGGRHRAEPGVRPGQDGQMGPGPTRSVHHPQPPGHRRRLLGVVVEPGHDRHRAVGSPGRVRPPLARSGAGPTGAGRPRGRPRRRRSPGASTGGWRRAGATVVPGRSSGRRSSSVGSAPFQP